VTSLQFIFPEIIPALNRNGQAVLSGEVWRLITPLFIQPAGLWQCLVNGVFFISFLPIAERLYGRSLILIYFGTGIVGQIVNSYWATTPGGISTSGGGSSTALNGVIGSLIMFILLNRKTFPKGYFLMPIAGFLGATVLVFFEDGHAASLLVGGLLGFYTSPKQPENLLPICRHDSQPELNGEVAYCVCNLLATIQINSLPLYDDLK